MISFVVASVLSSVALTGLGINVATRNVPVAAMYAAMLPSTALHTTPGRDPSLFIEAAAQATFQLPSGWALDYTPPNPSVGDFPGMTDFGWSYNGAYLHLEIEGGAVGSGSKSTTLTPDITGPNNATGSMTVYRLAWGDIWASGSASSSITVLTQTINGSCGSWDYYSNPYNTNHSAGLGPNGRMSLSVPISASAAITGP